MNKNKLLVYMSAIMIVLCAISFFWCDLSLAYREIVKATILLSLFIYLINSSLNL